MSISYFLIDMKFISKFLEIFWWNMYHFPILIFTKYNIRNRYSFQEKTENRKTKNNGVYTFQNFLAFSNFQIWKRKCFKDVPILSCILLKYFGDSWEVCGSRFGQHFRSSQNHQKNIAIGPGTLISHFGII